MQQLVTGIVVAGIAYAVLLGVRGTLDAYAAVVFVILVGAGILSVMVVRRSARKAVGPATCADCDGLNSPNAPYCKHCGASLAT